MATVSRKAAPFTTNGLSTTFAMLYVAIKLIWPIPKSRHYYYG